MIITADYHTHTTYSHGKGSILDNALSAKEKGLKEIGISDHGFSHPAFGLRKRYVPKMRRECDEATEKTGVKVLLGIESNITGTDGSVDLKPDLYGYFDIFLAGIHKFILYKIRSIFSLFIPNQFNSMFRIKSVPKRLIETNTKTLINTIKKNPVDAITHINFCCFSDPVEVAKAAADYGTYIEINSKKVHLSDEEWYKVLNTGARFIISSDAHLPRRVANFNLATEMIERINFPLDRIDNIDGRLPKFRFKEYKEKNL